MNLHQRGAHSLGLRLQVFQDPIWWLHKSGIVKLRHMTENTSLSRIECCALYKEIGKKVRFHRTPDYRWRGQMKISENPCFMYRQNFKNFPKNVRIGDRKSVV